MRLSRVALGACILIAATVTASAQQAPATPPAGGAPPSPTPTDRQQFTGTWIVTAAELAGEKAAELEGATFTFTAETALFTQKSPESGAPEADSHPYKLDETGKRIVIYQQTDSQEGMQRGIYQFGQAALFLCLTAPDATEFPTAFSSQPEFLLLRLERKQP